MTTQKENYLMLLRGEQPEWVPRFTFGGPPGAKIPNQMVEPPLLSEYRLTGGGKDVWGVEFVATKETGGAMLPKPGQFILKDIKKWRDVIQAPDISGVDWETMAKDHLDAMKIDRNETAITFALHFGYFQNLMAYMGFSEGLCAMHEEPDEVLALFDYICDFYCIVAENIMPYYQPDVFSLADDTAAWLNPFISPAMYSKLVIPFHDRQAQIARDAGIPIGMHNCGKCQCFIDDWLAIGVSLWDPAQTINDLDDIKKKYGNKLVIAGGWDARGVLASPYVTDEQIYDSVKDIIYRLAPGGGYAFSGGFLGAMDDEEVKRKNGVLVRAAEEIGHDFYK
ncbi:MAG: veratrol--corrinoid protein metyltransferase [Firmicutes bacterium]|nr:veratrol--corrinoid protein metyltransferase [Bacillota bacterium]